jgi:hypothetical protein
MGFSFVPLVTIFVVIYASVSLFVLDAGSCAQVTIVMSVVNE